MWLSSIATIQQFGWLFLSGLCDTSVYKYYVHGHAVKVVITMSMYNFLPIVQDHDSAILLVNMEHDAAVPKIHLKAESIQNRYKSESISEDRDMQPECQPSLFVPTKGIVAYIEFLRIIIFFNFLMSYIRKLYCVSLTLRMLLACS